MKFPSVDESYISNHGEYVSIIESKTGSHFITKHTDKPHERRWNMSDLKRFNMSHSLINRKNSDGFSIGNDPDDIW